MTYNTVFRFRFILMNGAAFAALLVPSTVIAQQTQENIQLETIVVQGDQNLQNGNQDGSAQAAETGTGPVNGYVAMKSTTGSKTDTSITEIPQSVSVIGREEMDDQKAQKIDEALRYTAGVQTQPFGTDPDTDWFYIRGFEARGTGLFLDGMPLYSYSFGAFQIDPFLLERVEVLKGPTSVLYGGSNPGGIVNLVSKRPNGETFNYLEAGLNNWGNAYFALDSGGLAGDNNEWSYRVTGRVAGGDQFTDYSEDLRGALLPQITYTPDDATKFTAYAYVAGLDEVRNGGSFLPYYGTVRRNLNGFRIDRKTFYGEPDLDNQDRTQFMVGYEFEHELESLTLSQSARYGWEQGSQTGPYGYGYTTGAVPDFGNGLQPDATNRLYRIGFDEEHVVNTFTTDTRAEFSAHTGPLSHSILAGVDYKYYNIDQVQASGGATPIDVENPVYGAPQGAPSVYLDQDLTNHQVGIYLQDQVRFGDGWLLTLNGRQDFVETTSESPVALSFSPSYESSDRALSGRAGLAYEFENGLTPYVSAATFFNPVFDANFVTGGDDKPFEPEKGRQFEGGIKYAPTADALITASVFHIIRENVVVPFATVAFPFGSEQLGEVTSTGFEIEGKANITDNLKVLAAFTAFDLEITKDTRPAYVGNTPFLIPEITGSLWLDYGITDGTFEGVSFGAGMRYLGDSWADNENTLKVPDVVLFDAVIRYDRDNWGVALNASNVFDEEYVSGCQGVNVCSYGEARKVTLSAHYKW